MEGYNSLNEHLKRKYGCKVYKLSLESGCTCPNRDGKLSRGGCIFCSEGGSGDFAKKTIDEAKSKVAGKIKGEAKYIAYFQSYTNTYARDHEEFDRLKELYQKTIEHEEVVALSIGTRPDCLSEEWVDYLAQLNKIKPVWVELGLQTTNEYTAKLINRGYELSVFEDAYSRLKAKGITVIVHVIIGLPGEGLDDVRATVKYLSALTPVLDGIKLQLMHVLKGTKLASMYEENPDIIHHFQMEEYVDFVVELLDYLPNETVVHRLTGDGPKNLLIEPLWTADKKRVLNMFSSKLSGR